MELNESAVNTLPLSESNTPLPSGSLASSSEKIWNECLDKARSRVQSQSFKTWFEPITPLRVTENVFILQVPSQFFSDWIEEHYYSLITELLTRVTGKEMTIEYEILPDDRDTVALHIQSELSQSENKEEKIITISSVAKEITRTLSPAEHPVIHSSLNIKYTF